MAKKAAYLAWHEQQGILTAEVNATCSKNGSLHFDIQCIYVSYDSQNKQQLFPCTALANLPP
jgi:hypothetical protein